MTATDNALNLKQVQQQLGQLLLTPDTNQLNKITANQLWANKLGLYNRLINGTFTGVLESIFPVTCKFFESKRFQQLAEEYRRHNPTTHYHLYKAVENFPDFVSQQPEATQWPFLSQLADYEWQEVVVQNQQNQQLPESFQDINPQSVEALESYTPLWNEVSVLAYYNYDIPAIINQLKQRESKDIKLGENLFVEPQLSHFLIYRDPHTLKARFFKLNGLTAQVIASSQSNLALSAVGVLKSLMSTLPNLTHIPEDKVMAQGLGLFQKLFDAGILLGHSEKAV